MTQRGFGIFLFLFCVYFCKAQEYALVVAFDKGSTAEIPFELDYPQKITTAQLTTSLQKVIAQFHNAGYLGASVDSIFTFDSTYIAKIHVGRPLQWVKLKKGNVPDVYLIKSGFKEKLFEHKPLNYKELFQLKEDLLVEAENRGYPFATIQLDSIEAENGQFSASLNMDRGKLIFFEKIVVDGNAAIQLNYLANYLGIEAGAVYNKKKLLAIPNRIKELPFLELNTTPSITFYDDKAVLNLSLKKRKASRFDFIVGLLPNTVNEGGAAVRRFTLTGDFKGEVYNSFGAGEFIKLQLEQLRPATPKLDLQVNYPYLLKLPFGVDAQLNFFKQDTTFLNVQFDIGIQYLLEGQNYVKAFWNNQSTRLLSVDTISIQKNKQLPDELDLENRTLGLAFATQQLDYRFNPRKGWRLFLKAGVGQKTLKQNSSILSLTDTAFNYQSLYDSLDMESLQYRIESQIETYLPLGQRATLQLKNTSGFVFSEGSTFKNEQFRLGGNRLLRGFDEASLFVKEFTVFTIEPRLLLSTNSYLYAFADASWVKDRFEQSDTPIGVGAGISFQTKAGLLGVSLAVGNQKSSGFDFRSPKIHIGYVSLF